MLLPGCTEALGIFYEACRSLRGEWGSGSQPKASKHSGQLVSGSLKRDPTVCFGSLRSRQSNSKKSIMGLRLGRRFWVIRDGFLIRPLGFRGVDRGFSLKSRGLILGVGFRV